MKRQPLALIETKEDIYRNISTLDKYIQAKKDPETEFALGLVKRGICFLRIASSDGYKFYPSRFIGYKSNTYDTHNENSGYIDGRETNRATTKILSIKLSEDPVADKQYQEYCLSLGFQAHEKGSFGVVRKYWIL